MSFTEQNCQEPLSTLLLHNTRSFVGLSKNIFCTNSRHATEYLKSMTTAGKLAHDKEQPLTSPGYLAEFHMAPMLKIEHPSCHVPTDVHNYESLCSSHAWPAIPLPPWKQ